MSRRPSRRAALLALAGGAGGLALLRCTAPRWLTVGPPRDLAELSPATRALVRGALEGLDLARLVDLHVHVAGLGGGGSGCWVHPDLLGHLHPLDRFRFELYLRAGGAREDERADELYVERLRRLLALGMPGRLLLLAFDVRVREDGTEDLERSMFRVPDAWVCRLAREHEGFLACASVHPYRPDAVERLERARADGAVAVKWLPNAMGIDPASPLCRPFLERMAALGLPLLVHTGEERAVWEAGVPDLGNPLRLRAALEAGVRVVALHCASLGEARDLDRAGAPPASAFELFLRLLDEAGPDGELYGELGAVTLVNRGEHVLRTLLERQDLHPRLVNGSDYPLVAVDPLVHLWQLESRDVLDEADGAALRELFAANPLLFDLVLKRRLRVEGAGGPLRFGARVFETARLFDKL